jgi:hypothetical protein
MGKELLVDSEVLHNTFQEHYDGIKEALIRDEKNVFCMKMSSIVEQLNENEDNVEKRLAKIDSVKFGIAGYNDVELGLHLTFTGENNGWAVSWGHKVPDPMRIQWNERSQWTEEERDEELAKLMRFVSKILSEAKVDTVDKLKGIPVEVKFERNSLVGWRVLTEVI